MHKLNLYKHHTTKLTIVVDFDRFFIRKLLKKYLIYIQKK